MGIITKIFKRKHKKPINPSEKQAIEEQVVIIENITRPKGG